MQSNQPGQNGYKLAQILLKKNFSTKVDYLLAS